MRDDLTYEIIGCAMQGASDARQWLSRKLSTSDVLPSRWRRPGIDFGREVEQAIYYEGTEVGTRRADFVVAGRVVVELKALIALQEIHIAQAKNYVVAYGFDIGLLLNFGAKSLEYKRIFNDKGARSRSDA